MFKKLIDKLLCKHKWDLKDLYKIRYTGSEAPTSIIKEYHCLECGKIKILKLKS